MKITCILLLTAFISISASAQKPAAPAAKIAAPGKTDTTQPRLKFNLKEMGFGAQGVGTSGCQYIIIQNTSLENAVIKDISTPLSKIFTIPSPAKSMYPVTIQPKRSMTISVCFVPDKPGDYKSKITVLTDRDSTIVPVWGKGVRPEDVAKLPKTDITIKSLKKGKEASITLELVNQSKVVLQIVDALGNVIKSYFNTEIVNPGRYEQNFDGTEKGGKKLEPGTFYARLIATETNTNHEIKMTKRFEIK
jgi:hypothetical protein